MIHEHVNTLQLLYSYEYDTIQYSTACGVFWWVSNGPYKDTYQRYGTTLSKMLELRHYYFIVIINIINIIIFKRVCLSATLFDATI